MITGTQFFLGKHHLQRCFNFPHIKEGPFTIFKLPHTMCFFSAAVFFRPQCGHHVEHNDYRDAILCGKTPSAKVLSSYTIKLINLNRHHLIFLKIVLRMNWSKKASQLYTSKTEKMAGSWKPFVQFLFWEEHILKGARYFCEIHEKG